MTDANPLLRKFSSLSKSFSKCVESIPMTIEGKVTSVVGTIIEASLPRSTLSSLTEISLGPHHPPIMAEVVGFKGDKTLLFPFSTMQGISPGALVKSHRSFDKIPVGDYLLGQVVDGFLKSFDPSTPHFHPNAWVPIEREAPNPIKRNRITEQLPLGVKAIDSLLCFGEGQRIAVMAGSGVGKSVLMGMIARWSEADINVIGLIGERGREVREFIERELGPEGLKRSIVVVSTSDQSPLLRIRAAKAATAIAEYFSSQGKKVLLMMDSLTRVAQAQREIGLAVGEPPTTKGYPPSVFSLLPKLLERCGPQSEGKGSISGLYTVLVDGDDFTDPIPDNARAILDGHIQLSRSLASRGYFPAIDIPSSISRVMPDIVSKQHVAFSNRLKAMISTYQENLDYIQIGSYQPGTNPLLDEALELMPEIEKFLKQDMNDKSTLEESLRALVSLLQVRK